MTLPATVNNGEIIKVTDGVDFSVNNLTILRNGNTIEGATTDKVINTKGQSVKLIFYNGDWLVD